MIAFKYRINAIVISLSRFMHSFIITIRITTLASKRFQGPTRQLWT